MKMQYLFQSELRKRTSNVPRNSYDKHALTDDFSPHFHIKQGEQK